MPSITSSQIPADVCIPSGFSANPIQFFDDYSWKTFIAMIWPALTGQRGQPDTSQPVTGSGPRVFETFKSNWEVFHNDGSAPAPWNTYDQSTFNACNQSVSFGDVVLASFSKYSDLGQAGFGTLVGPLVAQNTTYVRYLTGFNQTEFNQIANQKLYLRSNLPAPPNTLTFQTGSLDVKSSWILMTNIKNPQRYYTRQAYVLDPQTGSCSLATVGLVGLHIVQKTPTRPQWIWTTFEQVDNVPPAAPGAPGTFAFNDGTPTPMPSSNPYPLTPLKLPTPPPFNVQRLLPINSSTTGTNASYQKLLQAAGGPWQYYRLVMTQWPVPASQPSLPGTPNNTFPGFGATSAFANITMETFDQSSIRTGCMNCHTTTQATTDFLWSLKDHAFPPNVPNLLFRDESFRKLQQLLTSRVPPSQAALTRADSKAKAKPAAGSAQTPRR